MLICPKAFKSYQIMLKILPDTIKSLLYWPNTIKSFPKWRNFAKSGHTGISL